MKLKKRTNMPKKKVPSIIKRIIDKFPFSDKDIEEIIKGKGFIVLKSDDILAYIMNKKPPLDQLMKEAEEGRKKLITTDFALYEAINSMRGNIEFNVDKFKIFLWNVVIMPTTKTQISRDRINEIRRIALGGFI